MKNHGFVDDDVGRNRREKGKEENDWISTVIGDRAEQRIFDQIQSKFSAKPWFLINGFKEQDLFKVVKEKLQQDMKSTKLSDQESKFYKVTNRKFEEIQKLVKLWLEPLDEGMFMEGNRQKILDKMKGQEAKINLIALLPTEKLRNQFDSTINNYISYILDIKYEGKTLSKEEWEHLFVRKLLEQTKPDSEFDILLFQKDTSTIYHFECKASKSESKELFKELYEKAIYQLEKGKAWLEHIMKMLNIKPWNYVGYAAFPNMDNRDLERMRIKEKKEIKILTKDEMEDPKWNEILGKTSSSSPADDNSYKKVLALLVGSYYVTTQDILKVMPRATNEDLLRTSNNLVEGYQLAKKRKVEDCITAPQFSDLKEKPLGSVPNILFWNDRQKQFSTQVEKMKHTLLKGDYGTGLRGIVMSSYLINSL